MTTIPVALSPERQAELETQVCSVSEIGFSIVPGWLPPRMGVVPVSDRSSIKNGIEQPNGPMDIRMGVTRTDQPLCPTCGQDSRACPGHPGYVPLVTPDHSPEGFFGVLPPYFAQYAAKLMTMVCERCGRGVFPPEQTAGIRDPVARFSAALALAKRTSACFHCEAPRPEIAVLRGTKASRHGLDLKFPVPLTRKDPETDVVAEIHPYDVYRHLSRLRLREDAHALGVSTDARDMVTRYLFVPPTTVRPRLMIESAGARGHQVDDQSIHIGKIAAAAHSAVLRARTGTFQRQDAVNAAVVINTQVAEYQVGGVRSSGAYRQAGSKEMQPISAEISGKQGIIRGNLLAKRTDFSARTVITPNNGLRPDEVGIPASMELTTQLVVTARNLEEARACVRAGPGRRPGAVLMTRSSMMESARRGRYIRIPAGDPAQREKLAMELRPGYVVHRFLEDGDAVYFNRQPSLHLISMRAMFVRVTYGPSKTLTFNAVSTPAFNADFDGDEMNIFVPQTPEAMVEAICLASSARQLTSWKGGAFQTKPVQDQMLAANLLTGDGVTIDAHLARRLFLRSSRAQTGGARFAAFLARHGGRFVTGRELFSLMLPEGLRVAGKGFKVHDGELVEGAMTKRTLERVLKEVHGVHPTEAISFLSDVCLLGCDWITHCHGFTIGIRDVKPTPEIDARIAALREKLAEDAEDLVRRLDDGTLAREKGAFETEEFAFEREMIDLTMNAASDAMAIFVADAKARTEAGDTNHMLVMSDHGAGSKGKDFNLQQTSSMLGLQKMEGRIPTSGFQNRTLPFFYKYDRSPFVTGFVPENFVYGLSLPSTMFAAASGVESIVNSANGPSKSGYTNRKTCRSCESLVVATGSALVDMNNGMVVQPVYGGDAVAPNVRIRVHLPFLEDGDAAIAMDDDAIRAAHRGSSEALVRAILGDVALYRERVLTFPAGYRPTYAFDIGTAMQRAHEPKALPASPEDLHAARMEILRAATFHDYSPLVARVSVRWWTSPGWLANQGVRVSAAALRGVVAACTRAALLTRVPVGTNVGIISGENITEVFTQDSLNSFHVSGTSSGGTDIELTGLDRARELLDVSRTNKTPMCTIFLRNGAGRGEAGKRAANHLKNRILHVRLRDLAVDSWVEYLGPGATFERDPLEAEILGECDPGADPETGFAAFVELDRAKVLAVFGDVAEDPMAVVRAKLAEIIRHFGGRFSVSCAYVGEDEAVIKAVMRASVRNSGTPPEVEMRGFLSQLLEVHVHGIPGISATDIKKAADDGEPEYYVKCLGGAFIGILGLPEVDPCRSYTSDVTEMYRVFGVEGARTALIRELCRDKVIQGAGDDVDIKHVLLTVDRICSLGVLSGLNRHGMARSSTGPFSRACFEEPLSKFAESAVFGLRERVGGSITASIAVGAEVPVGTGLYEVSRDLDAVVREGLDAPFDALGDDGEDLAWGDTPMPGEGDVGAAVLRPDINFADEL